MVLVGVSKGLLRSLGQRHGWIFARSLDLSADDQPFSLEFRATAVDQSGAFGMHLKDLLLRHGVQASLLWNVGSLSLKATVLSWAAKAGVFKVHRRVLGYQKDPGDRSVFGYSPDIFTLPLREILRVIKAIAEERFLPDESRSGYWKNESEVPNIEDASVVRRWVRFYG